MAGGRCDGGVRLGPEDQFLRPVLSRRATENRAAQPVTGTIEAMMLNLARRGVPWAGTDERTAGAGQDAEIVSRNS